MRKNCFYQKDAEEDFGINICKLYCAATKGALRKWAPRKSSKRYYFKLILIIDRSEVLKRRQQKTRNFSSTRT